MNQSSMTAIGIKIHKFKLQQESPLKVGNSSHMNRPTARSGGAVLGLVRPGQSLEKCRAALESAGCVFVPLTPVGPKEDASAKRDHDADASTTCADPRSDGGDGSEGTTVRSAWQA